MKNYIFDFDGVIFNSRSIMFKAINDVVNYMKLSNNIEILNDNIEFSYPEEVILFVFKTYNLSYKYFDEFLVKYRYYLKRYEKENNTFANVEIVLRQLNERNKNLFIISDRRQLDLMRLLEINNIYAHFIEFLGRDNYGLKSNGNSLRYLIKKYNLDYYDTIYIGDKVSDFILAKSFKLSFGYSAYSKEPFSCKDRVDYVMNNVEDILKV